MDYYSRHESAHSGGIWRGIKTSFLKGSALTRLIYINIGIFLLLKIIYVLLGRGDEAYRTLLEYVGVPADPEYLLYRPWTLLTYMFTQFEFLHLLFNVLWLYWFGSIFLNYFSGKKLMGVYLLGGIAGAVCYIIAYNTIPYFAIARLSSSAIGASASVMAIVFAVCTYLPNHKIYIFLIGPVNLIYLAIFTALIDIISIPSDNAGGHIAHLGGAFFGCLFTYGIKHNRDIASWIVSIFEKIRDLFSDKKNVRLRYKKNVSEMTDQEYNMYKKQRDDRVNEIFDKISRSGYESLTKEEKEILFKAGRD